MKASDTVDCKICKSKTKFKDGFGNPIGEVCLEYTTLINGVGQCPECLELKEKYGTKPLGAKCCRCQYASFDGELVSYHCKLFRKPLDGTQCDECKTFGKFLVYGDEI